MTINAMFDEQVSVPAFSASPQHSSNEFDSAFGSLKIRFVENSVPAFYRQIDAYVTIVPITHTLNNT
ncbi:MAG: hypothetical protein KBT06_11445 [Prevotellaceae bacterium]|nr:hypothetical protein [Candidatus Colivivens equi]